MSTQQLPLTFQRWVIAPLKALRELPNGDGAFAALTIAFGLYERFLISTLAAQGEGEAPEERHKLASRDFDSTVTPEDFQAFWDMYRVGVQHSFQPKNFTKSKDSTTWGWDISEDKGYHKYPTIIHTSSNCYIIAIDPWKFIEHVVLRWQEHPELLNQKPVYSFGTITVSQPTAPQTPLVPVSRTSHPNPHTTYMQTNPPQTGSGILPPNMR